MDIVFKERGGELYPSFVVSTKKRDLRIEIDSEEDVDTTDLEDFNDDQTITESENKQVIQKIHFQLQIFTR